MIKAEIEEPAVSTMNIMQTEDIVHHITSHINCAGTWASWTLLSKLHYSMRDRFPNKRTIYANELTVLISQFPDKGWHWSGLSGNTCITFDMVKLYNNKPWNWFSLSGNSAIKTADIFNNPEFPWVWGVIVNRCDIMFNDTIFDYLKNDEYYNRGKKKVYNPNVTMDIIINHPDINWDWESISSSNNITFDDILQHPDLPWYWHGVSTNPNINIYHVLNYQVFPSNLKKIPWEWEGLSYNVNITYKDIIDNPDLPWSWVDLSFCWIKNEN